MLDKARTAIVGIKRIAHLHPRASVRTEGIVAGDSFGECDGHHIMIDFLRDFHRQNAEVRAESAAREGCDN
jgi:hypothetical protein